MQQQSRTLKRMRSEDDHTLQRTQFKIYVNNIMNEKRNSKIMHRVHDKTRKLLFDGARKLCSNDIKNKTPMLCTQYTLCGNGTITLRPFSKDDETFEMLERNNSKCCQKESLICDKCVNCSMPMCEECGYSCEECCHFICRSCVTLFGDNLNGRAICEKCQLYL